MSGLPDNVQKWPHPVHETHPDWWLFIDMPIHTVLEAGMNTLRPGWQSGRRLTNGAVIGLMPVEKAFREWLEADMILSRFLNVETKVAWV